MERDMKTPDATVLAPGLKIECWTRASEEELPFLGVLIEFDGIPEDAQQMALESALRHWQRGVGSVTRTQVSAFVYGLAGWQVLLPGTGRIARVRLSYSNIDEENSK